MVRIRLRRVGRKKQPSFRVVAADKESPRDGRFLEILGFYNPRTEPATIKLKEDRIFDWMSKGAQMSDGAEKVFRSAGLLERYERFKSGEDIEILLEEALAGDATRNISPKTRREPPAAKPKAEMKPEAKPEEPKEEKKPEAKKEEEKVEEPKVEEVEDEAEAEAEETEAKAKTEEPKVEEVETEAEAEAEETEAKAKTEEPSDKKEETKETKSKKEPKKEQKDDLRASIPEAAFKAALEDLGLASSVTSKLSEEGYAKIGDLILQMKKDKAVVLDLAGIGPKTVETISNKIAEYEKANK